MCEFKLCTRRDKYTHYYQVRPFLSPQSFRCGPGFSSKPRHPSSPCSLPCTPTRPRFSEKVIRLRIELDLHGQGATRSHIEYITAVDYAQALIPCLNHLPGRRSLLLFAPLFRSNILLVFPNARQANVLLSILHMYLFGDSCYPCCRQQAVRSMRCGR